MADDAVPVGEVPENANESCPGTASENAGKASACEGCPNQQICATAPKGPDPDLEAIAARMERVKHKILVLSGKGGVGKSTFSAQLAFALAAQDKQVGLLDIDICGPSIPRMLGLEGEEIHQSVHGWSPVFVDERLGVMSIGFMLPHPDEAVVWRGPRKNGLIKQFLKDVNWGDLDYLVVDSPPGTSDEHISLAQYLKATNVDGAVMLTTPQEVSLMDVRKEINFCKKVGIKVLGVVENMSDLQVPIADVRFLTPFSPSSSGTANGTSSTSASEQDVTHEVMEAIRKAAPHLLEANLHMSAQTFLRGAGGEGMAMDMGVPFLGKVPLDPALSKAAEEGRSCLIDTLQTGSESATTPSARALRRIIQSIVDTVEGSKVPPVA